MVIPIIHSMDSYADLVLHCFQNMKKCEPICMHSYRHLLNAPSSASVMRLKYHDLLKCNTPANETYL